MTVRTLPGVKRNPTMVLLDLQNERPEKLLAVHQKDGNWIIDMDDTVEAGELAFIILLLTKYATDLMEDDDDTQE